MNDQCSCVDEHDKLKDDIAKLNRVQEEQVPWIQHNWPNTEDYQHHPFHPLAGIAEELGELETAIQCGNHEEIKDALADCVIFAADFCTQMGMCLGYVFEEGYLEGQGMRMTRSPMQLFGMVAHWSLKLRQGIRKATNDDVENALMDLFEYLVTTSRGYGFDLVQITCEVWEKVRQRDFRKNANDGKTSE